MLLLILAFLLYLRRTQPFQYAVISHELPRLPLILIIIVTISGLGFTYVAAMVESALLVTSYQVESMVQFMEQHFNEINEKESGNSNVTAPSPLEKTAPESSPASQGSIRRFLWNSLKAHVDTKVEQVIEEPTKDVNIQVYKSAYRG